jgi:hypothetical protein
MPFFTMENIKSFSLRKALEYNNTGVKFLAGNKIGPACDLFRASLVYKYAFETGHYDGRDDEEEGTSQSIEKAEHYLNSVDAVLAGLYDNTRGKDSLTHGAFQSMDRVNDARTLRLCVTPILVDEKSLLLADSLRQDTVESREASAAIIFNLALAEHCLCASSSQAIAMYELAATLVDTNVPTRLVLSLMNNMSVFLYENGDVDYSRVFMCYLSRLLDDDARTVTLEELRGMEANVDVLTVSPFFASPAA